MENHRALRAAWLCGRAWFLETRLLYWWGHTGMLASAMVLLGDACLDRDHCSTGYMSRWMMARGYCVDGLLLVVGVDG